MSQRGVVTCVRSRCGRGGMMFIERTTVFKTDLFVLVCARLLFVNVCAAAQT